MGNSSTVLWYASAIAFVSVRYSVAEKRLSPDNAWPRINLELPPAGKINY